MATSSVIAAQQSSSSVTKTSEDMQISTINTAKQDPFKKLPNEITCAIAKELLYANDLRTFRLTSHSLAAAGKHEIQERLKAKKIASPRSMTNDYDPRPYCTKLYELYDLFPMRTLKFLKFVNISPRNMEVGDDTLSTIYFPNLERLWLQNLVLRSNQSVVDVLTKHSRTLKEIKVVLCEIIRPLAGTREKADILYDRYTWNGVLEKLDHEPFSLQVLELQSVHICTGRNQICRCHYIPPDGDRNQILRVRTARANRTDDAPTFKLTNSADEVVRWEGQEGIIREMVTDIMRRDRWGWFYSRSSLDEPLFWWDEARL